MGELSFLDLEPPFYGKEKNNLYFPVPVWAPIPDFTVLFCHPCGPVLYLVIL